MMKNNNLKETLSKLLPIVLLLAGITVLGEGVSLLVSQSGMRKTDAVIAEITEEPYLSACFLFDHICVNDSICISALDLDHHVSLST